jgi:hypothetical protein
MAGRRVADWRFPNEKQARAEETTRRMQDAAAPPRLPTPGPADEMPDGYWDAVLADPRAVAGAPRTPLAQQALRDIREHLLRAECRKCAAIIEIQTVDAMRLYGGTATWKEVGLALLKTGCRSRTGSRDDDGCWPNFEGGAP